MSDKDSAYSDFQVAPNPEAGEFTITDRRTEAKLVFPWEHLDAAIGILQEAKRLGESVEADKKAKLAH